MQRRFELLSVWLTVLAIAAGNAFGPADWLREAPCSQPKSSCRLARTADEELPGRAAQRNHQPGGREVAERGEGQVLVASPSPPRLLIDGRLKVAGSPVLDEPQADRHMLLALARSAVANSAGHVPLLRSTHLRI